MKQKKGYQKKYIIIDEINENGEKFFKLVELITDDKKFPQKKQIELLEQLESKNEKKLVKKFSKWRN